MTGGQVIIQIRNASGGKLVIDTTPALTKAGTFKRIQRAVSLQKMLVLNDIYVGGLAYPYTAGTVISGPVGYNGKLRISFEVYAINSETGLKTVITVYIDEDDNIYYTV